MQRVHERSLALEGGASGKFRTIALNTVCAHNRKDLVAQEYLEGAFDEEPELEFPPAAAAPQPVAEEAELSALVMEEGEEDVADKPASANETVTFTTAPSRCAIDAIA